MSAKPETERAELLRKIAKRLEREIDYQNVFSDMELLKEAAAILSADSKDAGEPVAWHHDCAGLLANNVELWVDNCPHCGKPRRTSPLDTNTGAKSVAEVVVSGDGSQRLAVANNVLFHSLPAGTQLYTRPQAADAQPLSQDQRNWIVATCATPAQIIDAVERAHGITGKDNAS